VATRGGAADRGLQDGRSVQRADKKVYRGCRQGLVDAATGLLPAPTAAQPGAPTTACAAPSRPIGLTLLSPDPAKREGANVSSKDASSWRR
jgi:hypothetical protein